MNRAITAIATAALLALGGCSKKVDSPPAPPAGSATAPAPAGSGSAAAAGSAAAPVAAPAPAAGSAAASVEVPTEMDFEDDATAKITDKNVETQVKALEKELDAK